VLNAASFTTSVASGDLVSIFGQGLATGTSAASSFPLPTTLGGTKVTLNNTPMALTFASPTQINAALPFNVVGSATVQVTTAVGSATAQVNISDTAPAIFTSAITHVDGSLVSASSPAAQGESLVIYLAGMGQVSPAPTLGTGQPAPSAPLMRVVGVPLVQFGNTTPIQPDFAGLTPGFVGVYQVNVTVPQNLTPQTYSLRVSVNGVMSNSQDIPVKARP
jgi:uncharacterized protein (TIGR03437 family)